MNKKQLWDSLLQQAISGKLVPQLDNEPAVEQIGPAPAPDEVPFELPKKWKWVKLKSIGQIIGGGTPSSSIAEYWDNPTVNWITSADLRANKGIFISSGARGISQLGLQKSSAKLFPAGTVIYTTRGACIGDVAIAAQESCTNQGCKSFVPDTAYITSLWGYYALMHAAPFIRRLSSGTTFAEISGKRFSEIAIPLPSIEEQRRIVAKLEELKPLVDQFGEAHDKLSELEANFPRKLKASILLAAMQGKLVPQLDTEPAVEQIGPKAAPEEVPFKLPEKWKWVQFDKVLELISGRDLAITQILDKPNQSSVPYITGASQIIDGCLVLNRWTAEPVVISHKKDVLLSCKGTVGKLAINIYGDIHIARQIMAIRCKERVSQCRHVFVKLFFEFVIDKLLAHARGLIPGISRKDVLSLWIPLPPLEEQRRIMERVEQLFAEIDKMSACKAP